MEKWKKIPGFGRYEISDHGNIRSLDYKNSGSIKILKPAIDSGYFKTMILSDEKKYHTIKIHRAVMLAFHGESELVVNHKDGNKLNNKLENLEYCTIKENVNHSFRIGLQVNKKGSKHSNAKLSESDIIEIREYAKEHAPRYGREALAKRYGVSSAHIKDIVTRRRNAWYHV